MLHEKTHRLVGFFMGALGSGLGVDPLSRVALVLVLPNGRTVPPSAGYLITPINQGLALGLPLLRRVPALRRRSVGPHPSREVCRLGWRGRKIKSKSI